MPERRDEEMKPADRGYSPIGLTFDSMNPAGSFGGQNVSSIKIISANYDDPIPACDGYTFVYLVRNARISGNDEFRTEHDDDLDPYTYVYVLVKTDS